MFSADTVGVDSGYSGSLDKEEAPVVGEVLGGKGLLTITVTLAGTFGTFGTDETDVHAFETAGTVLTPPTPVVKR